MGFVGGRDLRESWCGHTEELQIWEWEGKGALLFFTEVTLAHVILSGTTLLATTPALGGFMSVLPLTSCDEIFG